MVVVLAHCYDSSPVDSMMCSHLSIRCIVGPDFRSTPLKQMENSAFDGNTEKGAVEMTDVKVDEPKGPPHACQPDVCRSMHAKYLQEKSKMAANPWDRMKTLFLVGIIAGLTVWLLVYVVSARIGLV